MKTVQLLYSYLLIDKPFSLESLPSAPTKEKRFAYKLYLDMIYLMDQLAYQVIGKNKKYNLKETRFILRIESDERFLSLKEKYERDPFPFSGILPYLREKIEESFLYKEFEDRRKSGNETDDFWENIFKNLILLDPEVNKIIRKLPEYSLSGVERMKIMMDETFKNFYSTKDNIEDALHTLERSLFQARELYMRLLALPVELTRLQEEQLELNRNKYLPTSEDMNPNMKLVNNKIPALIERNQDFDEFIEKYHLSWRAEDPELLHILLKEVLASKTYRRYTSEGVPESSDSEDEEIESPEEENVKDFDKVGNPEIREDALFWRNIFERVIFTSKSFLEYMEEKSVFWNDDLETMGSFVLKTMKRFCYDPENAVLPMYKDGDDGKDAKFGYDLFKYVIKNKSLYRHYIEEALEKEKWEAERLAFMDIVIVMTAMAEIINFPEIPLNVSINEYIEIAKSYSTLKSGQFVNGLLASILPKLEEDKIISHKN